MDQSEQRQVRRRRGVYIPGYDPIHPRRYRELYRTESAAQAQVSGHDIAIRPRRGADSYGWHVEATIEDAPVSAEIEVLVWSDIVRGSMSTSIPATYWQLIRTAWTYIASGALRRLMWLRKGPVIAALYPVAMLLLQLLVAVLAGYAAARLLGWGIVGLGQGGLDLLAIDRRFYEVPLLTGLRSAAMWMLALVLIWRILSWFRAKDGKVFAWYLMHDYAYSARWGGAYPPALEERMTQFRDRIAAALREDLDEVLVVGHSSGAHLGVSILADLIRAGQGPAKGPALSFLSLGQVVPMVSFLPRADRLRADLHYLSIRDELTWVDVTAPGDGCAFALCDPVAVSGVAPEGQKHPLVISAAFTQTLSPERWKDLRWRFFRLHFQYLCAFDRPGTYDYFRITAGPRTLADRFAGRAPSKSRIDVAASKYTSMAA